MGQMTELRERARELKMVFMDLDTYQPDRGVLEVVPFPLARRFKVFPLFRVDRRLALGVTTSDLRTEDYISRLTGLSVEPVLVEESALEKAHQRYYLRAGQAGKELGHQALLANERLKETISDNSPELESETAPVARLVNHLLCQALPLRASDLHLEANPSSTRLRYRIDGVLHEFPAPPLEIYSAVVSRIKIMANLDIAEKRRPQDGRISVNLDGEKVDLRISVMPQLDGEGVVIRFLRSDRQVQSMSELGFPSQMLDEFRHCASKSHGMILVTGPTGAGKTTTLYATLAHINSPKLKIITLEDPVEYRLDGVCQTPVRSEINFTFARALRAVLRHDPDVLMVGEIRDRETAEIAARAALTGHLLLSSLHTNSAAGAITRLTDIGLPPYLILSSLLCVVNQRLVRRLCEECKVTESLPRAASLALGFPDSQDDLSVSAAKGCESCIELGYRGRLPISEMVVINDAMRALPESRLTAQAVKEIAMEHGFESLSQCALNALKAGLTSVEEVRGFLTWEHCLA